MAGAAASSLYPEMRFSWEIKSVDALFCNGMSPDVLANRLYLARNMIHGLTNLFNRLFDIKFFLSISVSAHFAYIKVEKLLAQKFRQTTDDVVG